MAVHKKQRLDDNWPKNFFFSTNTPQITLPPIAETRTSDSLLPSTTQGVANQEEQLECTDADLNSGVCKPLLQCPSLLDRLKSNPNDTQFKKFLKISNEICNRHYAVVCCPNDHVHVQVKRVTAIYPVNTDETPRKLPTMEDGCGYVDNVYDKAFGRTYKIGAWPWIALIGYEDGGSTSPFKCGGALITSRHVLTAAHCIRSDLTFVRLGEHDLSTDTESNHVDIPVVKHLKHSQYNHTDGHNDIALLYLGENVKFSEKIAPICVPVDPEFRSKNIEGFHPQFAGWGTNMEGKKSVTVLQNAITPIYNNDLCKELYKKEGKYFSEVQFDNSVICAGGLSIGREMCHGGDSGGPLMLSKAFESSIRYQLIGVLSYGIGCDKLVIPALYTRVTNYIEWIENGVADEQ